MSRPVIFLDDGGVMNDNERRGPQWQHLVGNYFAPRLGGSKAAWGAANRVVAEREFALNEQSRRADPHIDTAADRVESNERWLTGMCDAVGVAAPESREERRRLVDDATAFVTRNVHADYPGAVEAIVCLHELGYVLHTASGEHSLELAGYLVGMGVRDRFGTLYGPDLVNTSKAGPHYYERIFAHAGAAPADALVVDDTERVLEWAASVGARTVLCRPDPPRSPRHAHIRSLADLSELVERIIEAERWKC